MTEPGATAAAGTAAAAGSINSIGPSRPSRFGPQLPRDAPLPQSLSATAVIAGIAPQTANNIGAHASTGSTADVLWGPRFGPSGSRDGTIGTAPVSDKFVVGGRLGPGEAEAQAGLRPGLTSLPALTSSSSAAASSQAQASGSMQPDDYTPATSSDYLPATNSASAPPSSSCSSSSSSAAVSSLVIGRSHRSTAQWVPSKLLLKRMNVPDPLTKEARAEYEDKAAAAAEAAAGPGAANVPSAPGGGGRGGQRGAAVSEQAQQRQQQWQTGGGTAQSHAAGARGQHAYPRFRVDHHHGSRPAPSLGNSTLLPLSAPRPDPALLRRIFG